MVPVAIAIAAASAYMQWRNSEDARKATQAERDKIAAMFEKIQSPNFDPNSITPEEYSVVREHIPQAAALVQEVAPTIVQQTADMEAGMSAQRSALQRYRDISENQGLDPQLKALLDEASRKGQIEAQSREKSILQDANRRGMLNSGVSLAAQLEGGSAAMDRAATQGNQAAIEAYRQRLQALKSSADIGKDIRNEDVDLQSRNANIINAFNARTSANAQNVMNRNTDTANAADRFNINMVQDAANKNVGAKNEFAKYNQERGDRNAQRNFENEQELARAKAGIINGQISADNQTAADKNQMISGIASAGTGIVKDYAAGNAADAETDNKRRMAYYQKTGDRRAFSKNFDPFAATEDDKQKPTNIYDDVTDYSNYA